MTTDNIIKVAEDGGWVTVPANLLLVLRNELHRDRASELPDKIRDCQNAYYLLENEAIPA